MVAFAIHGSARRSTTWGGSIALRGVPPTELESGDELVVELPSGNGERFPIVVHRAGWTAFWRSSAAYPPPEGGRLTPAFTVDPSRSSRPSI
jgi:hypothetical protein